MKEMPTQRKAAQRYLVKARIERGLNNIYHNATPSYPRSDNEYEWYIFNEWFEDHCQDAIAYLQDGGAYGKGTGQWLYDNALKEGKSRAYAVRLCAKYVRDCNEERSRCNRLDSRTSLTNALYEVMAEEYGHLYTWGRGGRTLAPDGLIDQRGGSNFRIKNVDEVTEGMPYAEQVRLCQTIESFNTYVSAACHSIPGEWEEYKIENELQKDIDDHAGLKAKRVTKTIWV